MQPWGNLGKGRLRWRKSALGREAAADAARGAPSVNHAAYAVVLGPGRLRHRETLNGCAVPVNRFRNANGRMAVHTEQAGRLPRASVGTRPQIMNGDPPPPTPPTEGVDPLALDASAPSEAPLPLASSEPAASVPSVAPAAADALERFGSVPAPASARPSQAPQARPTFLFLGVVAAISLVADVTSKAWAEIVLSKRTLVD